MESWRGAVPQPPAAELEGAGVGTGTGAAQPLRPGCDGLVPVVAWKEGVREQSGRETESERGPPPGPAAAQGPGRRRSQQHPAALRFT